MNVARDGSASSEIELRRLDADLENRRAELEERKAQRQAEFDEKKAQRLADEKRYSSDAELKRLELNNLAGRGIRFTGAQATVAAAAIALLSGVVGGLIQAWQSGNVEQIKATGLVAVEQNKSDASIKIEQRKSDANIELEKLKFVTSLVAKATETPNRDEQIRNLQFYVNAGFIDEPYATKILAMNPDQYPSSTPLGTAPSSDPTISRLSQKLGPPSKNIGLNCGPVDNEALKSLLVTDKVGPLSVTILKPARTSLQNIFSEVQKADPDLLKNVTNLGSVCVRYRRGSSELSSHAFGTAIDLQFDEKAPSSAALGNGTAKQAKVVPFFERAGWQWGGPSDYMHFQAGLSLIEKWIAAGELASK